MPVENEPIQPLPVAHPKLMPLAVIEPAMKFPWLENELSRIIGAWNRVGPCQETQSELFDMACKLRGPVFVDIEHRSHIGQSLLRYTCMTVCGAITRFNHG